MRNSRTVGPTHAPDTPEIEARPCSICGNAKGNLIHIATEQMFGRGGEFRYLECAECGCLQLLDVPEDLGPFYPADYYSLGTHFSRRKGDWRQRARRKLGALRRKLLRQAPPVNPCEGIAWLERLNPKVTDRILDVGCGGGELLNGLKWRGFKSLHGVDPFIDGDLHDESGAVQIRKAELSEMSGLFDVIMFHYSFEHLVDQTGTLNEVVRLLGPNGVCLIKIPVVPCEAWETYGVNWVQLDAPRHIFIHSENSLGMLAAAAGLEVVSTVYDSYDLQFWGSELYLKNVPLCASKGLPTMFTQEQLAEYNRRAQELNAKGRGDQACFLLRRVATP